ncbi:MAG: hypothetical protein ABIG63_03890 [Chloroflexota bacterium]
MKTKLLFGVMKMKTGNAFMIFVYYKMKERPTKRAVGWQRPEMRAKVTEKKAKKLLVQTVVMRDGNPDDVGIITKLGGGGFIVEWQSGKSEWIEYHDAKSISIR